MEQLKTFGLALGAVALTVGVSPMVVQASDQLVAVETSPTAEAALALELTSYADLFSIAFPAGWQVSARADAPQVVADSAGATDSLPAMRTEVTWQDAPPREVVGQSLASIQAMGYTVTRYDAATIDGVTAVRLWVSEIPDELTNGFITYVGYPTATATIASYYGDSDTNLDSVLMAIHQSFARSQAGSPAPEEN